MQGQEEKEEEEEEGEENNQEGIKEAINGNDLENDLIVPAKNYKKSQKPPKISDPIDEMDFLDSCIKSNEGHANDQRFRADGGGRMPNYEKMTTKANLKSLISQHQARRLGEKAIPEAAPFTGPKTFTGPLWGGKKLTDNGKAKFLKPPPNFGGGRVGSASSQKALQPASREEIAAKRLAVFEASRGEQSEIKSTCTELKVKWNKLEFDVKIDPMEGVAGKRKFSCTYSLSGAYYSLLLWQGSSLNCLPSRRFQ